LGEEGLKWLADLFNVILRSAKMPKEWGVSTVIPLYKNKIDIQDCNNYRGIKLLSHIMKLWERVIERRVRKGIMITENQFGFMPGRSTIEAIYLLRRLMGLYRDRKVDLHMVFIDLKKTYDRTPRRCYGDAWKRKECRRHISVLLKICMKEVGRMLGRREGLPTTSTLG